MEAKVLCQIQTWSPKYYLIYKILLYYTHKTNVTQLHVLNMRSKFQIGVVEMQMRGLKLQSRVFKLQMCILKIQTCAKIYSISPSILQMRALKLQIGVLK